MVSILEDQVNSHTKLVFPLSCVKFKTECFVTTAQKSHKQIHLLLRYSMALVIMPLLTHYDLHQGFHTHLILPSALLPIVTLLELDNSPPPGSFPRILSRTQRPGFNRLCSSRVAFFGLVTFLVSRPFVNVIGWVMF